MAVAEAKAAAPPEGDADRARVLHEEINRLPERYRVPVVLCDLEGRTHEQAALDLGWPVGTVKSRQARARERLRDRLTRRGVAPGLGWLAIRPALDVSIPLTLLDSTTAAAVRFATSRAIVPGSAAALAREVIFAMMMLRWGQALAFLLVFGVASGVGLIAQDQAGRSGAGTRLVAQPQASPPPADPSFVEVKPGKLNFTLAERGVVEPSRVRDVLSEVEGTTTILRISPEGTQVKRGDLVAELDSATLRDRLTNQEGFVRQAEAAYQQTRVAFKDAELALKEYAEEIAPRELANLQGKIAHGQAGINKAKARLERTKLARQRMLETVGRSQPETPADIAAHLTVADRLDAAELDLQALTLDLETTQGQQALLKTYTLAKTTRRLQREVEQAGADEMTKQTSWELEKIKAAKLGRQVERCQLRAPSDGLIVHANDPQRVKQQQFQIEEGATVRERQIIFRVINLADPMRINAKVREAMVDQVKVGQTVRIKVEALPLEDLTGVVRSIAPVVDPLAFRADNRTKVYTTLIAFDQPVPNLRPGMVAAVDIPIFDLDDVLTVPITAVIQIDDQDRVMVKTPGGTIELRVVTLGKGNNQAIEVNQGLRPGDRVFLDPSARLSEPMKTKLRQRPGRPSTSAPAEPAAP